MTMTLVSAKDVALGSIKIEDLFTESNSLFIKERRASDGGRSVIKSLHRDLIPPPYSNKSRASEYGGSCHMIKDQHLYFVNKEDQAIYSVDINNSSSVQKTFIKEGCLFASLISHPKLPLLFAVMEEVKIESENIHTIVSINIDNHTLVTIHQGEDFYIDLTLSPDGNHLAFVSWNHPSMPWDATNLNISTLNSDGSLLSTAILNSGKTTSFIQPQFKDDHHLFYLSNQTSYWNIYTYSLALETFTPLTNEKADIGYPPWQYGFRNYTYSKSQNMVYTISTKNGQDILSKLNLSNNNLSEIPLPYTSLQQITSTDSAIILIGSNYNTPQSVVSIHITSQKRSILYQPESVHPEHFSKPLSLKFPTSNNESAYGLLYLPKTGQPPLIMRCHGGPTAFAASHCQKEIAFWTTRGFAFFDINYRGSFGFGKVFQDALNGKWGIYDTEDCYFAAKYIVEKYQIDPHKLFIQGSSSGGYTALQTLASTPPKNTFPFAGGISFYGISDLNLLEKDTHKFEKHYLQRLLDIPNNPNVLHDRSPINQIDGINSPILFLQGEEDLVVPKNQAEILHRALLNKGIPSELILFPNEGHGFRKSETIERALEASYAFYQKIISSINSN